MCRTSTDFPLNWKPESGGICISGKVYEEIKGKIDIPCHDTGPQQLKNITDSVRVYWLELGDGTGAISQFFSRREKTVLPLPDRPSIAVLPFVNLSNDPQQEYFSDGITDDIITELSRFSELFVIARNSSCTSQKYQLPACNSHMPAKPWVASIECVVIEGNMRLDPFYPPLATAWLGWPTICSNAMRKRCHRCGNVLRGRRISGSAISAWLLSTRN
jgi:hypothetical protein